MCVFAPFLLFARAMLSRAFRGRMMSLPKGGPRERSCESSRVKWDPFRQCRRRPCDIFVFKLPKMLDASVEVEVVKSKDFLFF